MQLICVYKSDCNDNVRQYNAVWRDTQTFFSNFLSGCLAAVALHLRFDKYAITHATESRPPTCRITCHAQTEKCKQSAGPSVLYVFTHM